MKNGKYVITKIDSKKYIGKDILYAGIWKKNDKHMIYNLIYEDIDTRISYVGV